MKQYEQKPNEGINYPSVEKTRELIESKKNLDLKSPWDDKRTAIMWLKSIPANLRTLPTFVIKINEVKRKWDIK